MPTEKKQDSLSLILVSLVAYTLFASVSLRIFFGLLSLDIRQAQIGCVSAICLIAYREVLANRPK